MADTPFFEVKNLTVRYRVPGGRVTAVNDVSLVLKHPGQTLGIVGESGCGKSTFGRAILRALSSNGKASGEVWLKGENLSAISKKEFRRRIAWKQISLVPQGTESAFNPVIKVEKQIEEQLRVHGVEKAEAKEKTLDLLESVSLLAEHGGRIPDDLSGGEKQRALIALALALNSPLIILDEPTSALDASVQAGVINLLIDLQRVMHLSYIFITHNIALARSFCELLAVFYGGRIVEFGSTRDVLDDPRHPYTQKLLKAIPTLDGGPLEAIPGQPPDLRDLGDHCPFREREAVCCDTNTDNDCRSKPMPPLLEVEPGSGHFVACYGASRAG